MMSNHYLTLKSTLDGSGIYAYLDLVPEAAAIPAVSISNVGFPSGRLLSGRKTRKQEVWRITVVATNTNDMYSTRDLILELDNTSNEYFQRIFVDVVNEEARGENEPNIRMFLDMTCTI